MCPPETAPCYELQLVHLALLALLPGGGARNSAFGAGVFACLFAFAKRRRGLAHD